MNSEFSQFKDFLSLFSQISDMSFRKRKEMFFFPKHQFSIEDSNQITKLVDTNYKLYLHVYKLVNCRRPANGPSDKFKVILAGLTYKNRSHSSLQLILSYLGPIRKRVLLLSVFFFFFFSNFLNTNVTFFYIFFPKFYVNIFKGET